MADGGDNTAPPLMKKEKMKENLGWFEWGRGWFKVVEEFLFQRIMASHLDNPLPLPPLDGITFVVTGATSGIGLEIARQLAQAGGHVVMAVRRVKLAQELIGEWQDVENSEAGTGMPLNVEVMELDLLSLDSVVRFAEAWNARLGPLHVLVNNAGIFSIGGLSEIQGQASDSVEFSPQSINFFAVSAPITTDPDNIHIALRKRKQPQRFSKDGYEEHMQVNHLAPSLLSMLLLPSLLRGSPSRIINVNSVMHYLGFVDTEDMHLTSGRKKYTSYLGYTGSKLAQVKFSSIMQKRLPAEAGINVICVSPGIVQTNVARDLPKAIVAAYHLIPYFIFNAKEGSRSTLFAATDPQVPEYCGVLKADEWPVCPYISFDCRPMNASEEAHNLETSREVWEKTHDMLGLPADALEKLIEGEQIQCKYGSERH